VADHPGGPGGAVMGSVEVHVHLPPAAVGRIGGVGIAVVVGGNVDGHPHPVVVELGNTAEGGGQGAATAGALLVAVGVLGYPRATDAAVVRAVGAPGGQDGHVGVGVSFPGVEELEDQLLAGVNGQDLGQVEGGVVGVGEDRDVVHPVHPGRVSGRRRS